MLGRKTVSAPRRNAGAQLEEEPAGILSTVVGGDADTVWETSSFCGGNGSCVEIARLAAGEIAVRDGKQRAAGPVLIFTQDEWVAFISGVKAGEFG